MTAFLALSNAVLAALFAGVPLAAGQILRGRELPVPADARQAVRIHMRQAAARPATLAGEVLQWQTVIGIELYSRAIEANADAESAIDSLLAQVYQCLSAATPPAGVVSWTLDPSLQWDTDEIDHAVARVGLTLRISHFTTLDLAASGG